MHGSSTARSGTAARAWAREFVTPLGAASVWAVVVAGGVIWPPLAHTSLTLALVGEVVVLTLALHALHEAGHVLAGYVVGLPFRAVTVGLLTVRREPHGARERLTLDVNRSWRRFAGCVEREVQPAPRVREALTVTALGGPAASFVGGALLLAAPGPWRGLGYVSILIGLLNAVPVAMLGQASDGMIVWRLWSPRPADVAWRANVCGDSAAAVGAAGP